MRHAYGGKDLFKSFRFLHQEDPLLSVMDIFRQYEEILDQQGLTKHFNKYEELRKKNIQGMVESLHPLSLRETVKAALDIEEIEAQKDIMKIFDFLLDTLKAFKRFHRESSIPSDSQHGPSTRNVVCFKCKGPHHFLKCPNCTNEEEKNVYLRNLENEKNPELSKADQERGTPIPQIKGSRTIRGFLTLFLRSSKKGWPTSIFCDLN